MYTYTHVYSIHPSKVTEVLFSGMYQLKNIILTEFPETLCRFSFSSYYYYCLFFFNFFKTNQMKNNKEGIKEKVFWVSFPGHFWKNCRLLLSKMQKNISRYTKLRKTKTKEVRVTFDEIIKFLLKKKKTDCQNFNFFGLPLFLFLSTAASQPLFLSYLRNSLKVSL